MNIIYIYIYIYIINIINIQFRNTLQSNLCISCYSERNSNGNVSRCEIGITHIHTYIYIYSFYSLLNIFKTILTIYKLKYK